MPERGAHPTQIELFCVFLQPASNFIEPPESQTSFEDGRNPADWGCLAGTAPAQVGRVGNQRSEEIPNFPRSLRSSCVRRHAHKLVFVLERDKSQVEGDQGVEHGRRIVL